MFRWLTKSRLRTALAVLFFCLAFAISLPLIFLAFVADVRLVGPAQIVPITGLVTAFVSLIGTISTVILAWRADRRTAKESELKLIQLQQQIAELQGRLSTTAGSPE